MGTVINANATDPVWARSMYWNADDQELPFATLNWAQVFNRSMGSTYLEPNKRPKYCRTFMFIQVCGALSIFTLTPRPSATPALAAFAGPNLYRVVL